MSKANSKQTAECLASRAREESEIAAVWARGRQGELTVAECMAAEELISDREYAHRVKILNGSKY